METNAQSARYLYLYTTSACTLCEKAKDILWPLLDLYPFRLKEIDIADSDELMETYGIHIPVIERSDSNAKLFWPFDANQLGEFLQN